MRQRIGRYDRAARAAGDRGDWSKLEHYVNLLERDLALNEASNAGPLMPEVPPSRAEDFTPERTLDRSDDDLIVTWAELTDDPAAQDQIMATLEWRDAVAGQRDAEIAEYQRQRQEEYDKAWQQAPQDASPLTNPARRGHRSLKPEQVCREEYDAHTHAVYVDAETACRGVLLNREGTAKGIDPLSLFSGPAARARKYGSEELRSWWARHGRITYTEWRYQWLGRDSDRQAARTARYQSLGEAVA